MEDVGLYRNPYALPIGYRVKEAMEESGYGANVMKNQEQLFSRILGHPPSARIFFFHFIHRALHGLIVLYIGRYALLMIFELCLHFLIKLTKCTHSNDHVRRPDVRTAV